MNLERIPDNYISAGPLVEEEGLKFSYKVRPKIKNGEFDTKVLLSWDEKNNQWLSFLEGICKEGFECNRFTRGPFGIGAQETIKLCQYFELPVELGNREGTIALISMTSPEQFARIYELEKTSNIKK
jgi:hypothetical protein